MIIKNKIHYIILNYDRFKMHFFIFEFFYSFLHIKILFFKTLISPLSVSKMVLYGELLSRRLNYKRLGFGVSGVTRRKKRRKQRRLGLSVLRIHSNISIA